MLLLCAQLKMLANFKLQPNIKACKQD